VAGFITECLLQGAAQQLFSISLSVCHLKKENSLLHSCVIVCNEAICADVSELKTNQTKDVQHINFSTP